MAITHAMNPDITKYFLSYLLTYLQHGVNMLPEQRHSK
jgi:hypothetical protein